jgi:8-oxo-dGTP pyrophosphatase MutT (NUDIX family)
MNFNNRKNFQITSTEDSSKHWISRSIAVLVIPLFECDGNVYVPLGLRSHNMPLQPSRWGLPCGFLDWGETANEAVRREVYEEVGLDLLNYCEISDQPQWVMTTPTPEENETVTLRFIVTAKVEELPKLKGAEDEVSAVEWANCDSLEVYQFAFNHRTLIDWARAASC